MKKCRALFGLLLAVVPTVSAQPDKATSHKELPATQSQPAVIGANSPNKQGSGQTNQSAPNPTRQSGTQPSNDPIGGWSSSPDSSDPPTQNP
jgi:hypothetical protein